MIIEYPIGTSGRSVVLTDPVVNYFRRHRQLRWYQNEAGGQLFARFEGNRVLVEEATGPRRTDRRTRASYVPDRRAEQVEILERHARGLHYVGDWHTHPEPHPFASSLDARSMADCVAKSTHQLHGFLLVIVGQDEPPAGLHVSIHDRDAGYVLASS